MNTIIDNLDILGLEKLWNATFTDKEDEFNAFIEHKGYETDEELMKEMKEILKQEIYEREHEKTHEGEDESPFYEERRGYDEDEPEDDIYQLQQEREEINKQIKELQERERQLNEEIEALMNIPVSESPVQKSHEEREQKRHMKPSVMEEIKRIQKKLKPVQTVVKDNGFFEWLKVQNQTQPEQDKIINEILNDINMSPTKWEIDFTKLNKYGKEKIVEPLIDVLLNVVAPIIKANGKYLLGYLLNTNDATKNNKWTYTTIKTDSFTKLIEGLRKGLLLEKSFAENVYAPNFSDTPVDGQYYWYFFDAVKFEEFNNPFKGGYNTRQGKFFPYFNKTNIDLSRYQVLYKNDDYIKNREMEGVPCVIYALSQLIQLSEVRKVACRCYKPYDERKDDVSIWMTNCYNLKHLQMFCEELSIYCRVHYYDEYAIRPQFRIIERGVPKSKSKYQIELAVYKEHYFVYEKTKYTRYFIQHYEELKDLKDAYKIVGKRKTGTYQRDSRTSYCLNSLDLLIEMMNNNLFEAMNFKELYELQKPLKDINNKPVVNDTPVNDIIGVEYDDYGKTMLKEDKVNEDGYIEIDCGDGMIDYVRPEYLEQYKRKMRKAKIEEEYDEIWGCKDNDYHYDCSDCEYGEWSDSSEYD